MKIHKTILTMLAAMLAIIGTTATVVHAEGPGTDESGGTNMTPGNVLSGGTSLIGMRSRLRTRPS